MGLIKRHLFLLLAISACLLSALCYLFLEKNTPAHTDEQYVASIQERIRTETKRSIDELTKVTAQLPDVPNYSFSTLTKPTHYPYYIFRNQRLLFWSDNRFIPAFDRIASVSHSQLVNFDQGRFIVNHARTYRNRDTLDVFSLITVYRYYTTANSFIQSGYNPDLFPASPLAVATTKGAAYQNIYDSSQAFLFSITPPKVDPFLNRAPPIYTAILAALGAVLLGLYVSRRLKWAARVRQYEVGLLWLGGYLLFIRGVMLYMGIPYLFVESELFSAKHYASSELAPSLGDLLLNGMAILVVAFYVVNNFFRSRTYNWLLHQPPWVWALLSIELVVLSYGFYFACFNPLNALYDKSQYTPDLALSIDFSILKAASILFFIILSIIYFLALHVVVSLFIRFNNRLLIGLLLFLTGTVLSFGLCMLFIDSYPEPLYLLNSLYFLTLYVSRFPRYLSVFRYKTSLYFFLGSFICASTAAVVVYRQQIREDLLTKRDIAVSLLAENDEFGEYLLHKAQSAIDKDRTIQSFFRADTLPLRREQIQTRIKTLYLDKYFDKYDTEVSSFDVTGTSLDASENAAPFSFYVSTYQQAKYKTKYENLYFVNDVGNQYIKEYVDFISVYNANRTVVGYIVLNLKLRKEAPNSVYPQLLIKDKLVQSPKIAQYSHAVYERASGSLIPSLVYSNGTYNYERKMPYTVLDNPLLYKAGLTLESFRHFGLRGTNGRTLVVSSPEYLFGSVSANFSFLYLILVLSVIVVIGLYSVQYGLMRFSSNYTTRIQFLLNLTFFIPLLLVVLIIMGVTSSNYIKAQEDSHLSTTKNIASKFQVYLDEHMRGVRSQESMEQELETIARDAAIDLNLFDTAGRLYMTTRKLMYESGHLSPYINPAAFMAIAEDKETQTLLNESLGEKQFSTAYASVRSNDGKLLGILGIPYFYSRPELDRQLQNVISSALSVFTGLFLLFLGLSYFASSSITRPLRLMTQKIRQTNLDRLNNTVEWNSDDEIGELATEYNRMLAKLEESKFSLAQSEKQSAWREMAQQVAHEIKNPLTPMKLTLQQLQRTLPGSNPTNDQAVSRTLDSLLDQIDNISDIATSFSQFANMPMPQSELLELTKVVNKAADLYADDDRVTILRQIQAGPIWVMGDRQLLMRIVTNLIINGIQSVPPDRLPFIDLRLFTFDGKATVEIRDNGQGIPEHIRSKVFLPHFSTKQSGNGIGLALSKRGIEHAGGSIWFETIMNVGTSFYIALPLAEHALGNTN